MVMVLAFVVSLEVLAGIFASLARDSGAATAVDTRVTLLDATGIRVRDLPITPDKLLCCGL